jgi:hypothetical protein
MNQDFWAIGTIQKVVFMGQRLEVEPPALVATTSTADADKPLSPGAKGFLAALLVLGILIVLFVHRRRVTKAKIPESSPEALRVAAIETQTVCKENTEVPIDDMQQVPSDGMQVPPELLSDKLALSSSSPQKQPKGDQTPTSFRQTIDFLCDQSTDYSQWISQDNDEESSSHDGGGLYLVDEEEDLVESLRRLSEMK